MARVLIIGYGNSLRSDDGFGWHVARELAARPQLPDVEVIACHQLTPDLAEQVGRAGLVIFIDAARGVWPALWKCDKVEPASKEKRSGVFQFTHSVTPGALLHWAAELYGGFPEAYCISVSAEVFEAGESLSPALCAALPQLLSQVESLMQGAAVQPGRSAGAGGLP